MNERSTIAETITSRAKKELTRFDGSILIRERDPETSFIDQLYVKVVNHDGSETLLTPKDYKLAHPQQQRCHMAGPSEGPSERGIPFAVERVNDLPRLASCGASLNYR